jgi:hypothetical protein
MATVFKAKQTSVDRIVAVKVLPSQFAHDPIFVQRFEREARAIANLEHPHILPLYDFGTQDGLTFMAMRYIKGGDLSRLMGQNMPNERIVEIVGNVARALDYAHKNGVVHRDIKPSNIMIDDNGEALLTDFGIAKTQDSQLTGTGTVLGTPDYMAPEQIDGVADRRSDIYSLGVVLYELLTGQPPYRAETPLAVVLKHLNEAVPSPRLLNPQVDEPLENVVIKAMAKNPDERYQTGEEMYRALRTALKEISMSAPTLAYTPSATQPQLKLQPAQPPASALKPQWLIGGVVGILVLTIVAAALLWRSSAAPIEPAVAADAPAAIEEKTVVDTPPDQPATARDNLLDGQIIFQDTFNANEQGWTDLEFEDEFGFYSAKIVNGGYRLNREAVETLFHWEEPAQAGEFDNFVIAVEAIPAAESDPFSYGLTFRGNSGVGFYTFEVSNNGHFMIRANESNQWHVLVEATPLAAIKNDGSNQLVVQADGGVLSFFINGQEAATLEDTRFQSGKIGLLINVEAGNKAGVDYDNLTIHQLSHNR